MRLRTKIGWLVVVAGGSVFLYALLTGPHMLVQRHILTYEARMPLPPIGSVPVEKGVSLPLAEEAAKMSNVLDGTKANLARGKTYYGYYCAFCHGAAGAGDGPVAESYVPRPPDLRTEKVRGYSDGEILRAMLLGVGHSPALEQIVRPEHRWYVVLYVRSLASEGRRGKATAPGELKAARQETTTR